MDLSTIFAPNLRGCRIHKADSKNYLTSVNEQFVNGMEGTAAPVAAAQVYQYLGPSRAGASFEAGKYRGATLTIFEDGDDHQKAERFAQAMKNPDAEILKLL
ncbi:hypothetical protein GALMADRAFT_213859 [Galerina marginata CBS 339.88]|uniref:Uncharacterized protein n=1 Tax=Galerina marginata (strain CBS 339.88) TaxID=685588 RepID=A0A067SKZ7_GALM3|nr:hypothetical protein GALMADRAFT_213859 [Galerina marginata CBS 339.88]